MVVQGHGFWHLMTGYGSYLIFTAAICKSIRFIVIAQVTLADNRPTTPKAYIFDTSGWIPTVKPSNILMSNGHIANGK
jgi:dihydroceramidase